MPSSYQVVLWKQESFVVLRPLQIEFSRNLLGRTRTAPGPSTVAHPALMHLQLVIAAATSVPP